MAVIRLYRSPDCGKCARIAHMHHRMDWLHRFEDSTEVSPLGPLRAGQIVVQDLRSGITRGGAEGFAMLCREIPFYWPILPLLRVPGFRRYIERETGGCEDGGCVMP
ncbi:MAG TPA: hypothetical protein VGK80_05745 [Rhodanobacteraceae bacterium]